MKKNTTNNATTATVFERETAINRAKRQPTIREFREKYGVTISLSMSGKMEGLAGVTTSVLENPYCKARRGICGMICAKCYAAAGLSYKASVRECYARNTAALTTQIIPKEDLPRLYSETGYFRFESFGDISTEMQVVNYFNMAEVNPHMKCALFTKNPWLIRAAMKNYGIKKPQNLVIVGSSYFTDKAMNFDAYDFIDKVFTVYTKQYAAENGVEIQCGGRSCAECGRCYENYGGRYVNELLK